MINYFVLFYLVLRVVERSFIYYVLYLKHCKYTIYGLVTYKT